MTDDAPATRYVKPAVAGARIPDPDHPGHDLPAEGASVRWTAAWIIRLNRGEIVEAEPPTADETPPKPGETATEAAEPGAPPSA